MRVHKLLSPEAQTQKATGKEFRGGAMSDLSQRKALSPCISIKL